MFLVWCTLHQARRITRQGPCMPRPCITSHRLRSTTGHRLFTIGRHPCTTERPRLCTMVLVTGPTVMTNIGAGNGLKTMTIE